MADCLEADDEDSMSQQSWSHFSRHHTKVGFREGASQAQDDARQLGFDTGFADAAKEVAELAWCRGVISGAQMLAMLEAGPDVAEGLADLEELISEMKTLESAAASRNVAVECGKAVQPAQPSRTEIGSCDQHRLCLCAVTAVDAALLQRVQAALRGHGITLPVDRKS